MKYVIAINGTPGTGKTTVAKHLKEAGIEIWSLNEIIKVSGCEEDWDPEDETKIVNEDCLKNSLQQLLETHPIRPLVLEGHLADLIPEKFIQVCFVLAHPIGSLRERLKNRKYKAKKIEDNILAEIMKDCLIRSQEAFGVERVKEIENLDSRETANFILSEIKKLFSIEK